MNTLYSCRWHSVFSADSNDNVVELLLRGCYEKILSLQFAKDLLGTDSKELPAADSISLPDACIETGIEANLQQLLESDATPTAERDVAVLGVAVTCLQLFVQNNWVGPPMDQDPVSLLPEGYRQDDKLRRLTLDYVISALGVDGESIYGRTRYPIYLFLASTLLDLCQRHMPDLETVGWWRMRCAQIHQALFTERSPTLKARVDELIVSIGEKEMISGGKHRELAVQFHLEAGNLCHFYYDVAKALDHMTQAETLAQLQIGLTGALGKRTRFQENDISQLVLEVKRSSGDPDTADPAPSVPDQSSDGPDQSTNDSDQSTNPHKTPQRCLPKVAQYSSIHKRFLKHICSMDDDTVMERITIKEGEAVAMEKLSGVEQAVVLARCLEIRKSHEEDGNITQEEALAYITGVLCQSSNWSVTTKALLMRVYWEQGSSRRMERSIKQLEELVNQFRRPEPCAKERLYLLYCVQLPPLWIVQREQADVLQDVGALKSALDIYLRLQMWEDVIKCFAALGRQERAERIINEQLARQETPTLWCYLGDVTRKKEHYVKAWELSGGHFPRAQKALGYWFLQRGKYEEVLPCFQKSLDINPLQVGVWFSYGCAAMAAQQYTLAATAFRRCVSLNADNFEAWSNLATTYIKLNQKPRAFLTYQEALRCEYENWRIWENYMLVATDCGEFQEVIRAYHRILDIQDRYTEVGVLTILVKAVCEDLPDAKGEPASKLLKPLKELFGRITSKVHKSADIWRLYSQLSLSVKDPSQEDRELALQYKQKAHHCATQAPNWEKKVSGAVDVAQDSLQLIDAYMECIDGVESDTKVVKMLSSAKLSIKSVLVKIKKQHTDAVSEQLPSDLQGLCDDLETKLTVVTEKITSSQ
ncbi:hypothetical protein NP493_249g09042 [Ridgeia piscesae]|uniref:Tetratricopeptide repeat protein 27 n=1 Tax=Ridgeia piscesae TaxID=27915 RepID=A0AAD9NYK6_RIDPI|nr:hypothetical protein NP493_249g09042 [Ridgeia piscesae]